MTTRPSTCPIINLNGDNAKTLLEGNMEVVKALGALLEAMREVGPHGRNYQLNPDGDYDAARKQYRLHCEQIRAMESFYSDQYLELEDQNVGRDGRR